MILWLSGEGSTEGLSQGYQRPRGISPTRDQEILINPSRDESVGITFKEARSTNPYEYAPQGMLVSEVIHDSSLELSLTLWLISNEDEASKRRYKVISSLCQWLRLGAASPIPLRASLQLWFACRITSHMTSITFHEVLSYLEQRR